MCHPGLRGAVGCEASAVRSPLMAFEPEESGRPRLDWPDHDLVPASRRDQRQADPEPEPAEPEIDETPSASVLFTVASRLEGLKTGLATVTSRLESLARSEEQFREFTTARLGEHAEQISQSMRDISGELDERAKVQDKAMSQLQSDVDTSGRSVRDTAEALDQLRQRTEEMGQSLETLAGHVQAVAEDLPTLRAELIDFVGRADARDEEMASELTRLVDEVKVLRRRLQVRAPSSAARRPARKVEPEPEAEEPYDQEEEAAEEAPASRRRSTRTRRS